MSASPRPILKRSSSSNSTSSSCSSAKSARFSNNISTTYLTHAPSSYNRKPIVVDPESYCSLSRGRTPVRDYSEEQDVDGYDSVLIREDEDSSEYYDSLTPLPLPTQTASVYAPSPSAYISYRTPTDYSPPRFVSPHGPIPSQSSHTFMPHFVPSPKRKLSNASDNSERSVDWGCLDGF